MAKTLSLAHAEALVKAAKQFRDTLETEEQKEAFEEFVKQILLFSTNVR